MVACSDCGLTRLLRGCRYRSTPGYSDWSLAATVVCFRVSIYPLINRGKRKKHCLSGQCFCFHELRADYLRIPSSFLAMRAR